MANTGHWHALIDYVWPTSQASLFDPLADLEVLVLRGLDAVVEVPADVFGGLRSLRLLCIAEMLNLSRVDQHGLRGLQQ